MATREFFGQRAMGASDGVILLCTRLGMSLGPWGGGVLLNRMGSYAVLYLLSALCAYVGARPTFWLRPPVLPRPAVLHPPAMASA